MAPRVVKSPDVRKQELLGIAQILFATKGYETTTVNDIIKQAGVAKGTFYYYFKSKFELLDELVTHQMLKVLEPVEAVVNDPSLDAIAKFNRVFDTIQQWKLMNRTLMMTALRVMFRDENAVARVKTTQKLLEVFKPVYAEIIEQGMSEGVFNSPSPENTADVVISMILGMRDHMARDLLQLFENPDPAGLDALEQKLAAYENALARIVGAPEGSFVLIDRALMRTWFSEEGDG